VIGGWGAFVQKQKAKNKKQTIKIKKTQILQNIKQTSYHTKHHITNLRQ
jgi:hypothetical protein